MKTITVTELRGNIYKLIDEIIDTGIPLEIKKGDKKLRILPVQEKKKLDNLKKRPDVIIGQVTDLPDIHWDKELNLDLP